MNEKCNIMNLESTDNFTSVEDSEDYEGVYQDLIPFRLLFLPNLPVVG